VFSDFSRLRVRLLSMVFLMLLMFLIIVVVNVFRLMTKFIRKLILL